MNTQITTERPRFKTRAYDQGFDLTIALPGVAKEALEVKIEKRLLTIGGERKEPQGAFENHDHEALRFELKVELHEDLDVQNIKATHQHGLLTLSLQKRKELAPRKINILAN
ncbi:MAG: HSP20 family protein [Akkermansiaceae bacterium]|jgi:HSP20 family protein